MMMQSDRRFGAVFFRSAKAGDWASPASNLVDRYFGSLETGGALGRSVEAQRDEW